MLAGRLSGRVPGRGPAGPPRRSSPRNGIGPRGVGFQPVEDRAAPRPTGPRPGPGFVDHGLRGEHLGFRDVRIRGREIDSGRNIRSHWRWVADHCRANENRQFHVEFNTHISKGGMPVPHQIADQPFVVGGGPWCRPVGTGAWQMAGRRPCSDHPHEAVVDTGARLEMGLHSGRAGAQGRGGFGAGAAAICGPPWLGGDDMWSPMHGSVGLLYWRRPGKRPKSRGNSGTWAAPVHARRGRGRGQKGQPERRNRANARRRPGTLS